MFPENYLPLLSSLAPVIQSVLCRISRWRTPTNWSRADWANEERSVVNLAVCQTVHEHSADSDSLAQAVYYRALSRALTRYRQEYIYSGRFLPFAPADSSDEGEELSVMGSPHGGPSTKADSISDHLTAAIESLPEPESRLIHQLFWQEHTQVEIARGLQISQRAVSERKRRALDNLRSALQQHGPVSTATCVSRSKRP